MKIEPPTVPTEKPKQVKLLPDTYNKLIEVHKNTLPVRTIQGIANDALKIGLDEMVKQDTTDPKEFKK